MHSHFVQVSMSFAQKFGASKKFACKSSALALGAMLIAIFVSSPAMAQSGPLVLERDGRVISLVPYAPNVLRVTMSVDKAAATSDPANAADGT